MCQRPYEVSHTEVGLTCRGGMLLSEHRQSHSLKYNVVAITVGISQGKERIDMITIFERVEHSHCLFLYFHLLICILQLPCMIEIWPVDIVAQKRDVICQFVALHHSRNLMASPLTVSSTRPSAYTKCPLHHVRSTRQLNVHPSIGLHPHLLKMPSRVTVH